jgi:hypothetical protein
VKWHESIRHVESHGTSIRQAVEHRRFGDPGRSMTTWLPRFVVAWEFPKSRF